MSNPEFIYPVKLINFSNEGFVQVPKSKRISLIYQLKSINKQLKLYPLTKKWSDRASTGSYTQKIRNELSNLLTQVAGNQHEVGHLLLSLFSLPSLIEIISLLKF